jgi:shikimate dehydrogenase
LCAVIGSPVAHSLSPALHNAAFAALDLDLRYVAFEVARGSATAAIDAVRSLGLVGLSVTMPHKFEVATAVDRLTPQAVALGSCNTVYRDREDPSVLWGDSTDGDGFVSGLVERGIACRGSRVVVVGAGGAGRAVVEALGRNGAVDIAVINRDPERGAAAASLARAGRVAGWDALDGADLVVNATNLGMGPNDPLPIDPNLLQPGQVVADLIYHPAQTALLAAAHERGCITMNGLPMLLNQAAIQFRHWCGVDAPIDAMRSAVASALT